MPKFTEEQKKIAMLLLHGPKTMEDLNKQLNLPYNKLSEEIKEMLKVGVIIKEGFPTKYKLKEKIALEVLRRKKIAEEDNNAIRIRAYIEMQAIEEDLLKKNLEKLAEAMQKDQNFTVYSLEKAKIVQESEYYFSYIEVNLSIKDFDSLVKFMYFYGPSSIEVISPDKITFASHDLQDGLINMADMINKYSAYIAKKLNKEELDKFQEKLYH
jgi:DNA-binding Lrp family transcriptional regulator